MATTLETGAKTAAKSTSVSIGTTTKIDKMEDSAFHIFFVDELKNIYWAEEHLLKAIPNMVKPAKPQDY